MKDMSHHFLDWLKSKPTDATYDYRDSLECAICQFLRSEGYAREPNVGADKWADGFGPNRALPEAMDWAVSDGFWHDPKSPDSAHDWTYGGAAKRLEAVLAA